MRRVVSKSHPWRNANAVACIERAGGPVIKGKKSYGYVYETRGSRPNREFKFILPRGTADEKD